jgi:hypothetical protein
MAHLPAQPRAGHCCHGLVRCPEHWFQLALYPHHRQAGPETAHLDQRYTASNVAEWIARQLTEAFPWHEAPRYLVRDRVYGDVAIRRIRAMGIRDKPIAPASPWQNGFAERLIGSIRRECLDHLVIVGEAHLRRILGTYACY